MSQLDIKSTDSTSAEVGRVAHSMTRCIQQLDHANPPLFQLFSTHPTGGTDTYRDPTSPVVSGH